jgi:hypothetical protein
MAFKYLIDSLDLQSNPNVKVLDLKACEKIKTELALNEHDGIILRGSRIVLPESLRLKDIQTTELPHIPPLASHRPSSLSSAEALIGYEGAKPLHDATPNMAVNQGGEAYNNQTQNSSQND